MLSWADRFSICCFLDNHEYRLPGHSMDCLLGAGALDSVEATAGTPALARLEDFAAGRKDWLFGHLGYGLTKETEPPSGTGQPQGSGNRIGRTVPTLPDPIGFPDLFFFVPEIVIELRPVIAIDPASDSRPATAIDPGAGPMPGSLRIGSFNRDQEVIFEEIGAMRVEPSPRGDQEAEAKVPAAGASPDALTPARMGPRFSREEYLEIVKGLQEHIHRGDCYEINFCQEFFSCPARIDPLQTWFSLSRSSPNPFAAYYKLDQRYLLCASPERYLKRTGDTLLSQPIKGTSPREKGVSATGKEIREERERLYSSSKDRAENVMVVDLVRNDLSKLCREGSVKVEELYGIYSFPQVHQMISTVSGELPPGTGLVDCIRATFPMGSMTGAPKNRVVGLITAAERAERGLFSGAVGYVSPGGDFDFNVVIRSILYNREERYVSYQVGSGITFYSDPAQEYEECLWKAEGIKKALGIGTS